jgi:lysophospholipase L1-like esterase
LPAVKVTTTNRARATLVLVAVLAGTLALAPAAGAAPGSLGKVPHRAKQGPKNLRPPAKVKIGRLAFATTPTGGPALLVAVRYPIQARGRRVAARVRLRVIGRRALIFPVISHPANAGVLRRPERRHTFVYVHEFRLPRSSARIFAQARARGRRPVVTVGTNGAFDIDHDGTPELSWHAKATRPLPLIPLRPANRQLESERPFCGSIPQIKLAPRQQGRYQLPACDRPVQWTVQSQPAEGSARIVDDELVVTAGPGPRQQEIKLSVGPPLALIVAPPKEVSVRAIGDSVTAGYGYYSDASQMPIYRLPECKPFGAHLNDACSSNSTSTFETGEEEPVPYAPDYGLANNVSWAAQWANSYGVTNYENLAVTGSEPKSWAPEGSLYATTREVEAEDPDYILMTMGANPILSETLFGYDPMACAIYADIFGEYSKCVERAFEKVNLRAELRRLYADLVEKTHSTIYLMQYHLSIPSSALAYTSSQIAEMVVLMNKTIAEVAAEVNPQRLQVIAPPHFNAGLDLEPVYAAPYECGDYVTDPVDGPSVQSTVTQAELHLFHPAEFCPQRLGEKPWVISGDTGIHPSAEGYAQMAAQLPAPN